MVSNASGVLVDGITSAAQVLRNLMNHKDPNVRFKAAVKLIELTTRLQEQTEFDFRLSYLERITAEQTRTEEEK
jgi:hypothetical protein